MGEGSPPWRDLPRLLLTGLRGLSRATAGQEPPGVVVRRVAITAPARQAEQNAAEQEIRRDNDSGQPVVTERAVGDPSTDTHDDSQHQSDRAESGECQQRAPPDRDTPLVDETMRDAGARQPQRGDERDIDGLPERGRLLVGEAGASTSGAADVRAAGLRSDDRRRDRRRG